jgi:uncharacterized membrane protein
MQYLVATDANYSFNLTPGTYLITANYFEGKTLVYTAQENVVISNQGEYIHDLLLFPPYDEELIGRKGSEVPDPNFSNVQSSQPEQPLKHVSNLNNENNYLIFALLAFIIVALLGIYLLNHLSKKRSEKPQEIKTNFSGEEELSGRNRDIKISEAANPITQIELSEENKRSSEKNSDESSGKSSEKSSDENSVKISDEISDESSEDNNLDDSYEIKPKLSISTNAEEGESLEDRKANLPDDLKELLDLIRSNGNRITQRELRKKSPYSESKVSLMLSDLEERGLIEKFKRGRGNIIRIPDEHIAKYTEDESVQG